MRHLLTLPAILLASGLVVGCADEPPTAVQVSDVALFSSGHSGETSAWMNQKLAEVRAATAKFQRVEVALASGYVSTVACAALPGVGAMGVHFTKRSIMGDATYNPLDPEVLVYEPQKNGRFKLVAVEYLIFRAPWELAENTGGPMFGDVPFVESFGPQAHGLPDHYELHVWLWRHNPEGMFAQWNPMVSCGSNSGH